MQYTYFLVIYRCFRLRPGKQMPISLQHVYFSYDSYYELECKLNVYVALCKMRNIKLFLHVSPSQLNGKSGIKINQLCVNVKCDL